ncbi:DUF3784 domain-containing protein [Clostridium lundense]|uniref:DUF3784 domain-containing protein n=1 Tax=Clostridium lundense TaxID=319475 RepID=UPI0004884664|nr:DUF3784 domain-containing protein [Clostridium lundense]
MAVWTITCLVLAVPLAITAIVFALLKEKGAILISGFNTLPKEEREKYDEKKMSIDMRNSLLLWSGILFIGAVLTYFFSNYYAMIAIALWIILLCKDVHIDTDKAFGKYKKHNF